MSSKLEIKTRIQIQKPVHEVFEAIVDPAKMTNYFISKGSGRIADGAALTWHFPEFAEGFEVKGGKMEKNKLVTFFWDNPDAKDLCVEITLTNVNNSDTLVMVTEKSMEHTDAGIKWLQGNTEGWANFLACLKAYMEYGINLRKGAFEFMRKAE